MRLTQPSLVVTFNLPTPETVTVTDSDLIRDSFTFQEQLLNGLAPSSNSIKLKLKKEAVIVGKILSYQVDAKAILKDGSNVLFTGYLSDNYTWKVNDSGESELEVIIEDVGTKLLGKAFLLPSAPSLYNLKGKIYSGNNSIVYQVCNRAGITIAPNQPTIATEICANIDKNLTCKDLLGTMLLEAGYTYYFDNEGRLHLYKIDCTSVSGIPVIDKDSLYVVNKNAITLTKKIKQYKQVNVSYDEYETRNDVLVYKDISGRDDSHPDCNFVIKPNSYYPVNLYEVATVADMQNLGTGDVDLGNYVRVMATNKAYLVVERGTEGADIQGTSYDYVETSVSEVSFIDAEDIDSGKEIIYIENVEGTVVNSGSISYTISQRGAKSVSVVLHNTGSSDATITKLQAKATITDVKARCIITAGEGASSASSDNVYSTTTKYIHTKDAAKVYANMIADYYKYCNYSYQFYTSADYSVGSIVNVVDNLFSGLTVNILITARSYTDKSNIIRYNGVAISPFNLTAEVVGEQTLSPISIVEFGHDGKGIESIVNTYSTSATPDGQKTSYSSSIPPLNSTTAKYLWIKETITYTDGTTSSSESIGAVYGDTGEQGPAGQKGDTGATVTSQYALKYSGETPVDADFSDERDTEWYVGYTYWKRYKYTDGDGTITYSTAEEDRELNDIVNGLVYFNITSSDVTFEKDLRSTDPVGISLSADSSKYYLPAYTWMINGVSYSGSNVNLSYTKKTAPDKINVSCTLASVVNGATYTQNKTLVINAIDKTDYNHNYGIQLTEPSGNFVEGDSFVLQDGDDYLPYVYTSGSWSQISDVSYWPTQVAQIRDIILANGANIPVTSSALYGYFKNLSAQQAQIDTISSSEIILNNNGVIKSQNYAEDSQGNPISGFKIDAEGNSAFVRSNVVDSIVSGSFSSNPLETQDETEGDQITGYFNTTENYNDGDVFDLILAGAGANTLTPISGTYGNSTISYVLAQNSAQRTEEKILARSNNITSPTTINGTLPVKCTNVKISTVPLVKSLNVVGYSGSNTATSQYSFDNSNWTNFTGTVTVSKNQGQAIYARQVFNPIPVSFINPTSWTSGSFGNYNVSLAYGNGVYVAAGGSGTNTTGYIWASTNGLNWSQVYTNSGAGFGQVAYGNGVFLAVAYSSSSSKTKIILRSSDGTNWSQAGTVSTYGDSLAYGNGTFRISYANRSGTAENYYDSTDNGSSWYTGGQSSYAGWCYGSGNWANGEGDIIYNGSQFIRSLYKNSIYYIYTSTNGSSWSLAFQDSNTSSRQGMSMTQYCNSYYFRSYSGMESSGSNHSFTLVYSTDLTNWSTAFYLSASETGSTQLSRAILAVPNVGVYVVGGNISKRCSVNTYTDGDWTVDTTGKLSITYDYTFYPVGANLMDNSKAILATISDSHNSWRTTKTVIADYGVNPTPFYSFKEFRRGNTVVNSFDARKYNAGSTFRILYTKYDNTGLNLTSAKTTIGGIDYYYNVKWNGNILQVFLNGQPVGSFSITDYFTSTYNLTLTPVGQFDAVLVKDVLPKLDSQYSLGEEGREFATAYIDNIYGHLTGNVTGNLSGNATSATSATTAGTCTGNSDTATRATGAGDGTVVILGQYNDEVNFGGTGTNTSIYFGHRAAGSRAKPTDYFFGGTGATATIHAAKVYGAVFN